jgi:hypothetical protein
MGVNVDPHVQTVGRPFDYSIGGVRFGIKARLAFRINFRPVSVTNREGTNTRCGGKASFNGEPS